MVSCNIIPTSSGMSMTFIRPKLSQIKLPPIKLFVLLVRKSALKSYPVVISTATMISNKTVSINKVWWIFVTFRLLK